MPSVKVHPFPWERGTEEEAASRGGDEEFTLAHLSDPHLSSLNGVEARDLSSKRLLGYLSWRIRRRAEHRIEVIEALLRDLRETAPDHIVITGDLTHLGLPSEFREAERWLRSLRPPSEVTVIPGNHDAYASDAWDRTFALWTPYMVSDSARGDPGPEGGFPSVFPSLRVRGDAALIGVSTARPSAPFLAVGSVGKAQLRKLERLLEETAGRRLFRIVLVHHPPAPGTVPWRKRLTDGEELRAILARQGAELVLHGHAHRPTLSRLRTPAGWTPAIGAPSASSCSRTSKRPGGYNLYRLVRREGGWDLRTTARVYSPEKERFVPDAG